MIHDPANFVNSKDSSSHMGRTIRKEPAEMARNGHADPFGAGESPWKLSIGESRGTKILSPDHPLKVGRSGSRRPVSAPEFNDNSAGRG